MISEKTKKKDHSKGMYIMFFKIGFSSSEEFQEAAAPAASETLPENIPRRSVVRVHFPERNMTLAYYNDRFDLHCGDTVYVDGKLEGKRGIVTEVNYTFRINLADYKRVIAVADTNVSGQLFLAGSHCVTFDRGVLPREKAVSWFKAPPKPDEEYVSGCDDTAFSLRDMKGLSVRPEIVERGHTYFMQNRVRYLCLDGTKGYALVEGTTAYDVEFEYAGGMIRALTCTCFCAGTCKHEIAAMLQLRETLDFVEENYAEEFKRSGYLAAVDKDTLFTFALGGKKTGSITL